MHCGLLEFEVLLGLSERKLGISTKDKDSEEGVVGCVGEKRVNMTDETKKKRCGRRWLRCLKRLVLGRVTVVIREHSPWGTVAHSVAGLERRILTPIYTE
jgi:hypothetical protein